MHNVTFEKTSVWGWEHAIRGMRNPMNSWARSDTTFAADGTPELGDNDRKLMASLTAAGEPHRKFLRQIFVSVDITAPIYWWSEFDTYGVGVVKNSTSTMHKLGSRPIVEDDYLFDEPANDAQKAVHDAHLNMISALNRLIEQYKETKSEADFRVMKQGLATSYVQKRTVTLNYEVLSNMLRYRKHHRLLEWRRDFVEWVNSLPHSWLIQMSAPEPGEREERIAHEVTGQMAKDLTDRFNALSGKDVTARDVLTAVNEAFGGQLAVVLEKFRG